MGFWERVKELIISQNTTQEWVSKMIGKRPDTFSRWITRDTVPSAKEAYFISKALHTSVEYLIDGTKGTAYIINWAEENGARWKPPPRMVPLIDAAEKLTDTELKKLIEIAKICKTEALESPPQSKIG
jgi:transcriptional regulator with XRE-family HTH domain